MKKITLLPMLLFSVLISFAQDTEAPTTPTNLQFVDNIAAPPDSFAVQWEHATDNIGVATYETYINGSLDEIIAYDGSDTIQSTIFFNLNSGTYCITILARDAAGNASPLTSQICRTINIVYENAPNRPYLSGFLNYSGDSKAIEISNETNTALGLSNYTLKVSYDGSGTWDTTYTFPQNFFLPAYSAYILVHPDFTLCAPNQTNGDFNHFEYSNLMTTIDGNDAIGLFKYDVLYDVIGEPASSNVLINTDMYLQRTDLYTTPSTSFSINTWALTPSNGNCPISFGATQLAILSTEEELSNSFQIYPNPTNGDTVFIQTKNNTAIDKVRLFDITGKQVFQQTNPSNKINVETLQQGMYILQLEINNNLITKKLIKQ